MQLRSASKAWCRSCTLTISVRVREENGIYLSQPVFGKPFQSRSYEVLPDIDDYDDVSRLRLGGKVICVDVFRCNINIVLFPSLSQDCTGVPSYIPLSVRMKCRQACFAWGVLTRSRKTSYLGKRRRRSCSAKDNLKLSFAVHGTDTCRSQTSRRAVVPYTYIICIVGYSLQIQRSLTFSWFA
jgi:hypothetical protein